jgi:hypothetical protein
MADLAFHAQPPVPHGGNIISTDCFSDKNPGENQVKHGALIIKHTGRQADNGYAGKM